jgi:hypothetical protein
MTRRICSILLFLLGLIANIHALSAEMPILEIEVFDYADLQLGTLQEFLTRTQQILTSTGIAARIKLCRGGNTVPCDDQIASTRRLQIRLIGGEARKLSNLRRPPLGQSFANHEGGVYASVFLERVKDAASCANLSWILVLAYATVHEVGHLLLGAEAHTAQGLMKPTWDRKDFEAMSQNSFHFSKEQARQLATRYGSSRQSQTVAAFSSKSP